MIDKNTNTNPENLPVIEENSLHRIVTTVKLYQEFNELGQTDFEKTYGPENENFDPKSLDGVCYERYYKNYQKYGRTKPFELLNSPLEGWTAEQDGVDLELGEYLKVYLDENKNVTKIQSLQPFYWKEWSFEEDIERGDWSREVETKQIFFRIDIVGNFTPNNLSKKSKREVWGFVKYKFELAFGSITVGSIGTRYFFTFPAYFYFQNEVCFRSTTFQGEACFRNSIFQDDAIFQFSVFKDKADFNSASFCNGLDF
jgi:hypothetical protein